MAVPRDMLFVKLVKVEDHWLWRNGMIGNKQELGLDCFNRLTVGKAKGKMENIAGSGEHIA